MRDIELRVIARLQELENKKTQLELDGSFDLRIQLGQFHGIEIDEWSASISGQMSCAISATAMKLFGAVYRSRLTMVLRLFQHAHISYAWYPFSFNFASYRQGPGNHSAR